MSSRRGAVELAAALQRLAARIDDYAGRSLVSHLRHARTTHRLGTYAKMVDALTVLVADQRGSILDEDD